MVELSGLHGIWLGPDHLSRSRITLYYAKLPVIEINYGYDEFAQAEKDKQILEEAKKEFDKTFLSKQ